MTGPRPIKVAVAEDEELLRTGICALLEIQADLVVVAQAADGAAAVDAVLREHPDVVLMDVNMPGVDGIEATRRLRAARSRARVLMLTTFDLDEYVHDALDAGASGFLLKQSPPRRLPDAVRRAHAGETVMDPAITDRLVKAFMSRPGAAVARRDELAELSDRELDVLRLLGRGYSNAEIAKHLYLTEGTVKSHITHMLGKLNLRSRLQAVVLAYEVGLIRPGESAREAGDAAGR